LALILLQISTLNCMKMKRTDTEKKSKYKNYLTRFKEYPDQEKSTGSASSENGANSALTKHVVDCDLGALTQFQLVSEAANSINYKYKCLVPKNCNDKCTETLKKADLRYCEKKTTPAVAVPTAVDVNALSSHVIKCESGFIVKSFQYKYYDPEANYEYTCCPAKTADCKTIKTPETGEGNNSVNELTKQIVAVEDGKNQAITGFKLISFNKNLSYEVSFCNITG